jgi:hypothetical protein
VTDVHTHHSIGVLPFCACFIEVGEAGEVQKTIGPVLTWLTGEYDALSTEEIYVAVAEHRRVCRLQLDLFKGGL